MTVSDTDLMALAVHVAHRRQAILATWRSVVKSDPGLKTYIRLTKSELNDHLPGLLKTFEQTLAPALHSADPILPTTQREQAATHGMQRRQQGCDPREVCREFGRFNECMVAELDNYAMTHPTFDASVMAYARRVWAELCSVGISESIAQYFRLQQLEAAGYLWNLDTALEQTRTLEKQRAELWHQAVHDIRGNLGVVVTAAAALNMPVPEDVRSRFLRSLDRNVGSLFQLLEDVMSLARLHADKEQRQLMPVDVASLMRELCEALQPQAEQRGLSLVYEGPATLEVEGDPVKIRRVAQNLVLNAIRYTQLGGVTVGLRDDDDHWLLWVRDTGPGIQPAPGTPADSGFEESFYPSLEAGAEPTSADLTPARSPRSEGIGLSIVKRLAALLEAKVEVDSQAATGTTFRVTFPKRYPTGADR